MTLVIDFGKLLVNGRMLDKLSLNLSTALTFALVLIAGGVSAYLVLGGERTVYSAPPSGSDMHGAGVESVASAKLWALNQHTVLVNTTADTIPTNDNLCTLREAIINANNNNQSGSTDCLAGSGKDTIDLPIVGTYTLALGALIITDDLTITGTGQATIIDGDGLDRVFDIDPNASGITVDISGLTIQNGFHSTHGGGILNRGKLTLEGITVTRNTTGLGGGSRRGGGGIYNDGGALTLIDSSVSANSGSFGAGILNDFGTLTLTDSAVRDNVDASGGGGIFNGGSGASLTLSRSTVSGNSATTSTQST